MWWRGRQWQSGKHIYPARLHDHRTGRFPEEWSYHRFFQTLLGKEEKAFPLWKILTKSTVTKSTVLLIKQWRSIRELDGLLYRVVKDQHHGACQQLLLPACLKESVLETVHENMGHQGIERTIGLLRKRCFWVGMYNDVDQWIKRCQRCILTKMPQPRIHAPMKSISCIKTPWSSGSWFYCAWAIIWWPWKFINRDRCFYQIHTGISNQGSESWHYQQNPVKGMVPEIRHTWKIAFWSGKKFWERSCCWAVQNVWCEENPHYALPASG